MPFFFLSLVSLFFAGCETIATKDDIGVVQSKVSNVQDDFYATSKVIAERFQVLETNTNERFSAVSSDISSLSKKNDRLSSDVENLTKEKAIISSQLSSVGGDIRELRGKIDELDYKFTEEMKKERADVEQKNFELRRDIDGLKKTYNDIISSISSLSKNLSSIQNDMLTINKSQLKITESINSVSSDLDKNTARINSIEEKSVKNMAVFLDEITRQESEIFWIRKELLSLKKSGDPAIEVQPRTEEKQKDEKIPVKAAEKKYYTVKKGDSLSVLASRFKTTIKEIKTANKLKKDTVFIGQKLIIPE